MGRYVVGFFAVVGVAVTSWAAGRGIDSMLGISRRASGRTQTFDPPARQTPRQAEPLRLHLDLEQLRAEVEAGPRADRAAPARRRIEARQEEIAAVPDLDGLPARAPGARNPANPPPWKVGAPAVAVDPDVPCDKASGLPPWRKCQPKRARSAEDEDDVPAAPFASPTRISTGKWN